MFLKDLFHHPAQSRLSYDWWCYLIVNYCCRCNLYDYIRSVDRFNGILHRGGHQVIELFERYTPTVAESMSSGAHLQKLLRHRAYVLSGGSIHAGGFQ